DFGRWPAQSPAALLASPAAPLAAHMRLHDLLRCNPPEDAADDGGAAGADDGDDPVAAARAAVDVPTDFDPAAWQLEHLRAVCRDLTYLVVALLTVCDPTTCPEMRVVEWQYLCAAHPSPQAVTC
ncbi:hypothetical protein HK405_006192, partial [Cladochytrium tenue]